jgi:hypothetical protein
MRNKVYLIRGWNNLSKQITLAEFERINVEHVLLITALRKPQFLPPDTDMDPNSIMLRYKRIMDHWKLIEHSHLFTSEYANVVLDHGGKDVKAVEGEPLYVDWFFESVKSMHKAFGQIVIEIVVNYGRGENGVSIAIDGREYSRDEAIELLKPDSCLG